MAAHAPLVGLHILVGSTRWHVARYDAVRRAYTLRNVTMIPFSISEWKESHMKAEDLETALHDGHARISRPSYRQLASRKQGETR